MKINIIGKVDSALKTVSEDAVKSVLNEEGQPNNIEVTIKFVTADEIRALNLEKRNKDSETDVLSFPNTLLVAGQKLDKSYLALNSFDGKNVYLGDCALCLPVAKKQAKEFNVTLESEVRKLIVHSILHLLGYDHIKDDDYVKMHAIENKILGENEAEFKSGFVAVVGRPNVGKSSLVNSLVGEKVSITSPKPQTTRNKIYGIFNDKDCQIVFVDTPGEIHATNKLAKYMEKSISEGAKGVDAIMVVVDGAKIGQEDYKIVEKYAESKVPVFVVINKTDITSYQEVYPKLAKLNEYKFISEFVSVSALKKKNLNELISKLKAVLPNGEPLFDEDSYTDKSVRFMVSEIIREKVLLLIQKEIPHFSAIEILSYNEGKGLVKISADIICEKASHKQIIIGKNGDMIKKIGTLARTDIEKLVGKKVNLELFVKVRAGWQGNSSVLGDLGYDLKSLS
ncbi:MAG: GTPase Era [bacterium]|nr:GTPase Era [bacterium]